MSLPDVIARPLIAGMFIYGGLEAARRPDPKAGAADRITGPITEATGITAEQLVRANGIAQVAAGSALALGIFPRPAAVVLAATLVPTTIAGHRFWEQDDAAARRMQTIQFLKNTAMLGGLLLAAASHGGRPSLPWRARRAVHKVVEGSAGRLGELPLVRS
ncbi:MAG: DoxX family protein [Ilumatobacteraceae bacterium]